MNRSTILEMEKVNKLTPIKQLDKKDKRNRILWLFECECGNLVEFSASDVKLGRKIDCGCGKQERLKLRIQKLALNNTLPNNEGNYNKLYGTYKRGAKHRGYKFLLTKEDFKKFLNDVCYYCGSEPSFEYTNSKLKNNILIYNGIDRKDNTKDYTIDNCVTACGICNRMKMDLEYNHFIEKIKQIYERLNNEGVNDR